MPFGIGPGELILVLVIALIVFGPKRLPELGGSMGKAIREFRRASSELTREFSESADARQPDPSAEQAALASIIKCPACGGANPKDTKFCGHCGKGIDA